MSNILDALATGSKRPRVHNAQMVTKLPASVKELVESYAAERQESAADVVRDALREFFERRGYGK